MSNKSREQALAESTDMAPVEGTVDVEVPISTLWEGLARNNVRWVHRVLKGQRSS